jgi:uncharacterized linocin/CFP29 family protein
MIMDDLRRELAPISAEAWKIIDAEARAHLEVTLAARRIVDFTGPLGWAASAVPLGQADPLPAAPHEGVQAALRRVQRLAELRAPFELSRREIDAIDRGSKTPELEPLRYPEGEIQGIFEAAEPFSLTLTRDYQKYPLVVSEALARLRTNGVGGPYAIVLGPDCYKGLTGTATSGGYPVIEHVKQLIGTQIFWAPGVRGALVASQRGGDFELVVGRDLSIGYARHDESSVQLYIEESLAFRVLSPEAAVPLVYR